MSRGFSVLTCRPEHGCPHPCEGEVQRELRVDLVEGSEQYPGVAGPSEGAATHRAEPGSAPKLSSSPDSTKLSMPTDGFRHRADCSGNSLRIVEMDIVPGVGHKALNTVGGKAG